jgi:hypothetical protein
MNKYSIYFCGCYQSTHRMDSNRGVEKISSYSPNLRYIKIVDEDGVEIPRSEWEQWDEKLYNRF